MIITNEAVKTRPSRTYKNGIGKPVVAKLYDDISQSARWKVIFPPCNNFGIWPVEPEARSVRKAQDWCDSMNHKIMIGERIGVKNER